MTVITNSKLADFLEIAHKQRNRMAVDLASKLGSDSAAVAEIKAEAAELNVLILDLRRYAAPVLASVPLGGSLPLFAEKNNEEPQQPPKK